MQKIYKNKGGTFMKKLLVAVDGSQNSIKAAETAIDIAKHYGSAVTFLMIADVDMNLGHYGVFTVKNLPIDHKEIIEAKNEQDRKLMDEIIANLHTEGVQTDKKILVGIPYEEIVDYAAKENYDLIVMGRRGLSAVERFFMGSVTQRVLANASCSVLVVKE